MSKQTGLPPLRIVELAVDPADVDRTTYPVTMRLNRPLSAYEVQALAASDPSLAVGTDSFVLPEAQLDDVARSVDEWHARLQRAQAVGEELVGEEQVRAATADALRSSRITDRNVGQHLH